MSTENRAERVVYQTPPVIVDMAGDDGLTELVPVPTTANLPATVPESTRAAAEAVTGEPEFDAYMAVSRLIVGGSIEGTAQLVKRLQKIEGQLIREQEGSPSIGEINSTGDVIRYAAVGLTLSASEGFRKRVMSVLGATDLFWEFTGNTAKPLTENRFTGFFTAPFERALESFVGRGQETVNGWVERGRREEPLSREMALETAATIMEEFITILSENPELAELVQQQSAGLVGEVVDEVRSRTVSADVLAETLVRRLLRRPVRTELPAPSEEMQELVIPKTPSSSRRD